ncbi:MULTISPECIES: hypothetical protein [Kocuria]|uniref:hypothetical protein n=1 Tax=Kocuria TaxID=57493 RepID=UPI0011A65C73|nr:hypothetical protein [Kocuria indica]
MRRTIAAVAVVAGLITLTGCQENTKLTELEDHGGAHEQYVGKTMTLDNEIVEVFGDEFLTMGEEKTVVYVDDMPHGLHPGDDITATGTVAQGDIFDTPADRERLMTLTDEGTANYLANRDTELYLKDATVTKKD